MLNLDKTNRNLIEKKEKFEQEKKSISQKKDKKLFLKSKDLSTKIESLAEEQIKVQGRIWDWNIAPMFKAWAEIAGEMKNKNDWNHFAKHVLREVIDYNKVMVEVKK